MHHPVIDRYLKGQHHEVMWRMLERQPRSRLGLLALSTTQSQVFKGTIA